MRSTIAVWVIILAVGTLPTLTGCRPTPVDQPKPLQSGRQDAPTPGFIVYRQER